MGVRVMFEYAFDPVISEGGCPPFGDGRHEVAKGRFCGYVGDGLNVRPAGSATQPPEGVVRGGITETNEGVGQVERRQLVRRQIRKVSVVTTTVYAVSGQPAVVSVDGVQAAEYMLTVTKAPAVTSNFPIQGPDDDPLAEYLSDHDLNATEEDGDVIESDAALFVAEFRSGNDITVSDSVEPINLTITLSSSGENRISE